MTQIRKYAVYQRLAGHFWRRALAFDGVVQGNTAFIIFSAKNPHVRTYERALAGKIKHGLDTGILGGK